MGHATACWMTGGKVQGIEVHGDEGGVTKFVGGWRWFIIPAGIVRILIDACSEFPKHKSADLSFMCAYLTPNCTQGTSGEAFGEQSSLHSVAIDGAAWLRLSFFAWR